MCQRRPESFYRIGRPSPGPQHLGRGRLHLLIHIVFRDLGHGALERLDVTRRNNQPVGSMPDQFDRRAGNPRGDHGQSGRDSFVDHQTPRLEFTGMYKNMASAIAEGRIPKL